MSQQLCVDPVLIYRIGLSACVGPSLCPFCVNLRAQHVAVGLLPDGLGFQFHPASHDAVAHGDVVASHKGDGQVFGEGEHREGAPGGVRVSRSKIGFSLAQGLQHRADVTEDVRVQLPRQFSNLLAGHREGAFRCRGGDQRRVRSKAHKRQRPRGQPLGGVWMALGWAGRCIG